MKTFYKSLRPENSLKMTYFEVFLDLFLDLFEDLFEDLPHEQRSVYPIRVGISLVSRLKTFYKSLRP